MLFLHCFCPNSPVISYTCRKAHLIRWWSECGHCGEREASSSAWCVYTLLPPLPCCLRWLHVDCKSLGRAPWSWPGDEGALVELAEPFKLHSRACSSLARPSHIAGPTTSFGFVCCQGDTPRCAIINSWKGSLRLFGDRFCCVREERRAGRGTAKSIASVDVQGQGWSDQVWNRASRRYLSVIAQSLQCLWQFRSTSITELEQNIM